MTNRLAILLIALGLAAIWLGIKARKASARNRAEQIKLYWDECYDRAAERIATEQQIESLWRQIEEIKGLNQPEEEILRQKAEAATSRLIAHLQSPMSTEHPDREKWR